MRLQSEHTMKKTAYEKQIETVIKDAAKISGFTAELTRQYTKLTGEAMHRTAVDRWLHRDADKRVTPNAIAAEYLMAAVAMTRKALEVK